MALKGRRTNPHRSELQDRMELRGQGRTELGSTPLRPPVSSKLPPIPQKPQLNTVLAVAPRQTSRARLILSPRWFLFPRIGRQESVVNCPAPGYTQRRSEGNRWRQVCFT
jgi:hypothetical protein